MTFKFRDTVPMVAQVYHYGNQGFSRNKIPPTNMRSKFFNHKLKVVNLFQI